MDSTKRKAKTMSKFISDNEYRLRAKEQYKEEGYIEIDDTSAVSCADRSKGAYVQAWVWVENEEDGE